MISLAVVADMYSVESSAYIDTQALLRASGRSLVNIENIKGHGQLPWLYLDYVGVASIKEHSLCSIRQVTREPQY